MGGGVGITAHAPFRIATDNSMWAMPEAGIGFFTDVAGSYFLPRLDKNPAIGLYLGLTGQRLRGKELNQFNVATHFVKMENM